MEKNCKYCAFYEKGYRTAIRAWLSLTNKQMAQQAYNCAAYIDVDKEPIEAYNRRYFGFGY